MATKRANGEGSVYKYNGRYYVQGYVHGVRRKVSRRTMAEAKRAWAALEAEARKGVPQPGAPVDVAGQMTFWLQFKRERVRYKTYVNYEGLIRNHIIPHLGPTRLTALTPDAVERWQQKLSLDGLSPSTVRQARIALHQALAMAVRHGVLNTNPVDRTLPPHNKPVRPQHLNEEAAQRLIRSARDAVQRGRLLLALSLGLRQGEILGLRWDCVVLEGDRPRLTVRRTLQRQTGRGLVLVDPKTEKSRRTLGLAPVHVEVLRAIRHQQLQDRLRLGSEYHDGGFVFATSAGTPIDPANDRKQWYRQLESAGVPKVKVHAARHTAATLMLGVGQSLPEVQQVMGHSSIRTTVDVYGHLASDAGAEAIRLVAERLTG